MSGWLSPETRLTRKLAPVNENPLSNRDSENSRGCFLGVGRTRVVGLGSPDSRRETENIGFGRRGVGRPRKRGRKPSPAIPARKPKAALTFAMLTGDEYLLSGRRRLFTIPDHHAKPPIGALLLASVTHIPAIAYRRWNGRCITAEQTTTAF
jgi:hypothetical protein